MVSFVDHPAALKSVKHKVKLVDQTMTQQCSLYTCLSIALIDGACEEKVLGMDVK